MKSTEYECAAMEMQKEQEQDQSECLLSSIQDEYLHVFSIAIDDIYLRDYLRSLHLNQQTVILLEQKQQLKTHMKRIGWICAGIVSISTLVVIAGLIIES